MPTRRIYREQLFEPPAKEEHDAGAVLDQTSVDKTTVELERRRCQHNVIGFVEQTCGEVTARAVPIEERVAVFDNDGTLWCEKPLPTLDCILRRLVGWRRHRHT